MNINMGSQNMMPMDKLSWSISVNVLLCHIRYKAISKCCIHEYCAFINYGKISFLPKAYIIFWTMEMECISWLLVELRFGN